MSGVAILTAVWPAILTAAREALELNHVEAGELFDSCAIHDNEWRAPNDGTVEYLTRGAMFFTCRPSVLITVRAVRSYSQMRPIRYSRLD